MTDKDGTTRLPLLGGRSRNFAAGVLFAGCCVLFLTVFMVSWPLGPSHVDEGSVTTLRLAIAVLAFAQMSALMVVGFFLFDILKRIQILADAVRRPATPDDPQ